MNSSKSDRSIFKRIEDDTSLTLQEELNKLYQFISSLTRKGKENESSSNIEEVFSDPKTVSEISKDLKKFVKQRRFEEKSNANLVEKLKKDLRYVNEICNKTDNRNYELLASIQERDVEINQMKHYIEDLKRSNEIKLNEISLLKTHVEQHQHSSQILMKQNSRFIFEHKTHDRENSFLRAQLLKTVNDGEKLSEEINEMKSIIKRLSSENSLLKSRSFSPVSDVSDDLSIENMRVHELSPKAEPFKPFGKN
jgi:hypothetical protein